MRRAVATTAAVIAALAIAGCGESPEDEARDQGEQVGEAVRGVYDADSAEAAGEAIDDLRAAAQDIGEDTRERVRAQVETQTGSLDAAVEAVAAGQTAVLQETAQQIRSQADAFRSGNDSISNEFWRGFEDGYDD